MCFGEKKYRTVRENLIKIVFHLLCLVSKKNDNVDLMKHELQSLRDKRDKCLSQQEDLEKLRLENTVRRC